MNSKKINITNMRNNIDNEHIKTSLTKAQCCALAQLKYKFDKALKTNRVEWVFFI